MIGTLDHVGSRYDSTGVGWTQHYKRSVHQIRSDVLQEVASDRKTWYYLAEGLCLNVERIRKQKEEEDEDEEYDEEEEEEEE